jgi:hypothetical protein
LPGELIPQQVAFRGSCRKLKAAGANPISRPEPPGPSAPGSWGFDFSYTPAEVVMRQIVSGSLAVGLLLGLAQTAPAADELQKVVDKAIKAHGVKAKDKDRAVQTKAKGTVALMGGIKFTKTVSAYKNKFKDVTELEIGGQAITQTLVYNGKQAWLNVNGEEVKVNGLAGYIKEAIYVEKIVNQLLLKDKGIKLSALGEMNVNGKPAVGIKVSKKGHKDINLYFDKKTGLLAKMEHRTKDLMSQKEVTEERIVVGYRKLKGQMVPKKLVMKRDGKKYVDFEVTKIEYFDKLDDSEFAKP